ncbi:Uncharacterised protein [Chlamydia abortus]|nr:Uncharacterised protein [Chlamydia abortus]
MNVILDFLSQRWFSLILFAGVAYAIYWVCTHRDELMIYHELLRKGRGDRS